MEAAIQRRRFASGSQSLRARWCSLPSFSVRTKRSPFSLKARPSTRSSGWPLTRVHRLLQLDGQRVALAAVADEDEFARHALPGEQKLRRAGRRHLVSGFHPEMRDVMR
jgi:hypothetical protein